MMKKISYYTLGLVALIGVGLIFGAYTLSFPLTVDMKEQWLMARLPRVCAALLTGAMLGCGGAVLKRYTQNDLADPGLIGIASGGQLMMVLSLIIMPQAPYMVRQIAAVIGSGIMLGGLLWIQQRERQQKTFVLFGFAISALTTSIVTMLATVFHFNNYLTQWSSGGLQLVSWSQVALLLIAFVLGWPLIALIRQPLAIYETEQEMAHLLGVDMKRFQRHIVCLLALYIGVATSVIGNVIFFGLMVATVTRRRGMGMVLYIGASVMLLADIIARVWSAPEETSLVAVIAVIAAPFFFYLVRKQVVR